MIPVAAMSKLKTAEMKKSESKDDLVARWEVPLCDKVHLIEFEHGTASGKRIVRVDGKEILRRDWMFKLVGDESFQIGPEQDKHACVIRVDPMPGFTYEYRLVVGGQDYADFLNKQDKTLLTWTVDVGKEISRVVLDKQTLDIWVDGQKAEAEGEFTDRGTETKFIVRGIAATIMASPSGNKRNFIQYNLYVGAAKIQPNARVWTH